MLEMKDQKLDLQSIVETTEESEQRLRTEVDQLIATITQKNGAITTLSDQLVDKAKDNAKLSENLKDIKYKILLEQCFQQNFAAVKCAGSNIGPIRNNLELTIGFVHNRTEEDEFYLEIEMKAENAKTGEKDSVLIPMEDVDEIEHVEGTFQFYIHYRASDSREAAGISAFIKRIGKK